MNILCQIKGINVVEIMQHAKDMMVWEDKYDTLNKKYNDLSKEKSKSESEKHKQ